MWAHWSKLKLDAQFYLNRGFSRERGRRQAVERKLIPLQVEPKPPESTVERKRGG